MQRTVKKTLVALAAAAALLAVHLFLRPLAFSGFGLGFSLGASSLPPEDGPALGVSSGTQPEEDQPAAYIEEGEWTKVTDFQSLSAAIGAGKTNIKLTQDIEMRDKILLTGNTVIDGKKEDGTGNWKIDETRVDYTFRLVEKNLTVTVQNLNINSYDYYGFVTQKEYTSRGDGATVIYRNVHYRGPQMIWLPYNGTAKLYDTTVDIIRNDNRGDAPSELAEATQLILGGETTVTKEQGVESLIWIYNTGTKGKPGLLRFENDSRVTLLNTQTYLTYRSDGVSEYNIEIGDNAVVDLRTNYGWCEHRDRYIDNFTIGSNSTVTMSRSNRNQLDNYYKLYIGASLRVGPGSAWVLEDVKPALRFVRQGVTVELDNPRLVRIDQPVIGQEPGRITMTGKTFNAWYDEAFGSRPQSFFNAPHGEAVTVTCSGGSAEAVYTSRVTGETVKQALDSSLIPYGTQAQRFVMGGYELEIHPLPLTSTAITGSASPVHSLQAAYHPAGTDPADPAQRAAAEAGYAPEHDESGRKGFRIEQPGGFAAEQDIDFHLLSEIDHTGESMLGAPTWMYALESRRFPEPGEVSITAFPETLDFGVRSIPGEPTYFPLADDAQVVVTDSRSPQPGSGWTLSAVAAPLTDDDTGRSLEADAIGVMRDGEFHSMREGALLWAGSGGQEVIAWEKGDLQNGPAVLIGPYQTHAGAYRAAVVWTVSIGV